jgi:hypothetical protein
MKYFPLRLNRAHGVIRLLLSLSALNAAADASAAAQGRRALLPFSINSGDFTVSYDPADGLITVGRAGGQVSLATRLAGGDLFGATLPQFTSEVSRSKAGDVTRVTIVSEREWAKFRGTVETYEGAPGLFRFRLDVTTKRPTVIGDSSPEFHFVDPKTGRRARPRSTLYTQQGGIEAPVAYLYNEDLDSLLLYLQNLTSLNEYINYVQGDPRYTVRADGEGLGFRRPQGVVPGGVSFTISDSFLWLSTGRPADDVAYSKQFVRAVSQIYDRLPKPPTVYTDWPFEIAPQAAGDLLDPMNGVDAGGTRVLKAYVGEKERDPESIVSLDVLIPARRYARKFGADANLTRLISDLERSLPSWHVSYGGGKVFANFPFAKREVDAWYFIYPLVQLTELALDGDEQARRMLLESAPRLIEVGRAMDYEFSFMLDVVANRRADDRFREYDTLGGYAYVMLGCRQLTGEAKYLEEAKRAVEHIRGKGFDFTYEPHFTAITLEALAWLHQLTGDRRYIELGYVPLANIFAMTWLWEPDYGFAAGYQMFLGTNPVPSADQVAAFEIHNVWWYLNRFYLRAEKELPAHVRKLLAEYLKYQITIGHYTLPRFLPGEALSTTPDWGVIRRDMAIPIEDLKDGFHKSAMVGQEIYGAGEVFRFASEPYHVFGPSGEVVLYAEYPVTAAIWDASTSALDFTLGGGPEYGSRVRVYFRGGLAGASRGAEVRRAGAGGGRHSPLRVERSGEYLEFYAPGGGSYRVLLGGRRPLRPAPHRNPPAPLEVPKARVAGILGAAGVVQARAGGVLSVPVVVDNPSTTPSAVSFEAALPPGWVLEGLRLSLAPGASEGRPLRLRVPADVEPGKLYQIKVSMRYEGRSFALLETLVRRAEETGGSVLEDFDVPSRWFLPTNENSRATVSDGFGLFTTVGKGVGGFETRTLTLDFDKNPQLNFNIESLGGQFAMKIYEVGRAPYGIYILPQIPVLPHLPLDKHVRINLRERTGWSGIHTFRLGLYVVGDKGDTLRLRDWSLSLEE